MENPYFATRRTRDVLGRGVTRGVTRGPRWHRRAHGLLVPTEAEADADPVTARLADAAALLTPGCAIGGWASMRLQQNPFFDGGSPLRSVLVHCPRGTQLRRRDGVAPFRGLTYADEIIDLGGLDVTTMARAVFDEMRLARTQREAVVALDMGISTVHGAPTPRWRRCGRSSTRTTRSAAWSRPRPPSTWRAPAQPARGRHGRD